MSNKALERFMAAYNDMDNEPVRNYQLRVYAGGDAEITDHLTVCDDAEAMAIELIYLRMMFNNRWIDCPCGAAISVRSIVCSKCALGDLDE